MRTGQIYAKLKVNTGETMVLRSLAVGDGPSCTRFINTLVRERKSNPILGITQDRIHSKRQEEEEYLSKVLKGIRKNDAISEGAFVDHRMIGNSSIIRRSSDDIKHTGLLGIGILDGYRGDGLGQRMLRILLGQARRVGITLVELEVFSDNRRAIHVYKKLGFKVAGRVPGKVRRNGGSTDVIIMFAVP